MEPYKEHDGADTLEALRQRLLDHLQVIYPELDNGVCAEAIISAMGFRGHVQPPQQHQNHWDESDVLLITYGDSIVNSSEKPLQTLHRFLEQRLTDVISGVHILPFYPYSSDDGFSVIHYRKVNEALGDWGHIRFIADEFKLMADVVINHCSAVSGWFDNFKKGEGDGSDYFYVVGDDEDLSHVVRPRTSSLRKPVQTANGEVNVWCTFSHDQVDLDFRNPKVLVEFVEILRFYLDQGVQIFRFDAVAFLWKVPGTDSINLAETHEVVRLLRTVAEHYRPDAVIITETNIPNRENLSYFGNGNEAHQVYNFSLPPLLVNTLITGDCKHLKSWMMSMPPARPGTTYFNFIASHDGIGLRPAEGLLEREELDQMLDTMQQFGGKISWRALDNGERKPYEINISLFDALQGTTAGTDEFGLQRFICAHAIMLGLEGMPAIYIHSLLGTRNDLKRVEHSGQNRCINRHKWDEAALLAELDEATSSHAQVFAQLSKLIAIRKQQSAFHPNAIQFTLQLGQQLFGYWRQSMDRQQSIFAVSNISDTEQTLNLADLNLIELDHWHDLIGGEVFDDIKASVVLKPYQTLWISNL